MMNTAADADAANDDDDDDAIKLCISSQYSQSTAEFPAALEEGREEEAAKPTQQSQGTCI